MSPNAGKKNFDLQAVRRRLADSSGPEYWRSLEELAETEEFQWFLNNEFSEQASNQRWSSPIDRRNLLKLMGASLALAGLSACTRQPEERIVPYVRAPEEVVPGKPLFFATAMPMTGGATGLLVESHMGRPTKIEGNPQHPGSLGATDVFAQAAVLTLYDPDRAQVLTHAGRISTWFAFVAALNLAREEQRLSEGAGLRLLTETVISPTLGVQIRELLDEFPKAKWHQYEPCSGGAREGARLALGAYAGAQHRFDKANVVLALDSDFLAGGPGSVRYARDFTARRRVEGEHANMNRLYVVESTPSPTGSVADHRLPLRAGEVEAFARALAEGIAAAGQGGGVAAAGGPHAKWIAAVVRDLLKNRGASIVIAGEQQPPVVHALVHQMNQALGNVGSTVLYTNSIEAHPVNHMESLRELVEDLKNGRVDVLVILGGNPVYTAPADLQFAEQMSKVKFRVHLSLYADETSELCHWQIPESHFLEAWSDTRAYDGTVSIVQPLIAPLYQGSRSAHEVLVALIGKTTAGGYDAVRQYWQSQARTGDFEEFWQTALHDGLIANSAFPARSSAGQAGAHPLVGHGKSAGAGRAASAAPGAAAAPSPPSGGGPDALEVVFRPDPTIYDGRYSNNGWLQELPKPLTQLVWDNAALISAATAQRLGVVSGDLADLRVNGRTVRVPLWISTGHADNSITIHFGYGRKRAGKVGTGRGFNAFSVYTSDQPYFAARAEARKAGGYYPLVSTQVHHGLLGRPIVRSATLQEFSKDPEIIQHMGEAPPRDESLYPEFKYEGYAWGMAIDLGACTGCSACVVACQAENNIPVVGKLEVSRGREMHWLRIDHYYKGGLENPEMYNQPMLCQHCENAPCEVVCPVAATMHTPEGLNAMVYNRCVGTRYCSNNCPYKVRRFNFFLYSDWETDSLKLMRNPDVTVRSRGVMEKCTYCVQRIQGAKILAEKEDRAVRDGEIVTACQAACPTEAIVFGDINDQNSRVAKLKAQHRNYGVLAELNTRPRTTYLARLRNPNPELEG